MRASFSLSLVALCAASSSAFVTSPSRTTSSRTTNPRLQPSSFATSKTASSSRTTRSLVQRNMMDPSLMASVDTSLLIAETQAWVQPTAVALDLFTNFFSLAMLIRVVLSWYPQMNVKEWPWSLVVFPTEPLLKAVRGSIPPAFGVDITPIVWLGFFTFAHEILLGQQGLLTMKMKYGI